MITRIRSMPGKINRSRQPRPGSHPCRRLHQLRSARSERPGPTSAKDKAAAQAVIVCISISELLSRAVAEGAGLTAVVYLTP